jgi:eukaryotic-like serine/threonine-protein kinase
LAHRSEKQALGDGAIVVNQPVESHAAETQQAHSLDWKGTSRFEVLRCIGRGGMGAVYEARDRERGLPVALKTLLHFDPVGFYRFKQEFRTLADVSHPNLVRLYELVGTEADHPFFSMELVRGTDFLAYVRKAGDLPRVDESGAVAAGFETHVQEAHSWEEGASSLVARAASGRATPADIDRLLPALRQLVEGICALHAAGKLHRDIKPSNALVTLEGRVVLLDFGVATDLRRSDGDDGAIVGTARYMAPEQALEEAPTPAADWYSVGVVLYEALVGAPPFDGPAVDVVTMKNTTDPRPPSEFVDGVPADLEELCMAMLSRAPEDRPTGAEISRRLNGNRAVAHSMIRGPSAALVGREAQTRALQDAFEAARKGAVTVRVSGRAGMGKSALVQQFVDGIIERGEAIVLRGRAYEREFLPYKAVDSVVDALSHHLLHLSDNEASFRLPAGFGALARLFPVLRSVSSKHADEPMTDPRRTRRRAFAALRELLGAFAAQRPLVLAIDDVQWGDTDSAALLLDLIRPPHAPPMLLLLTHREEDARTAPFLTELRERWPSGADVRDVAIGPLQAPDARRLAVSLLGAEHEGLADAVARESAGSPFLIEELARDTTGRLLASRGAGVTIEQVVGDRLGQLPEEVRRLAEIVAVGGRPLPLTTLLAAAGLESADDAIALLAARHLVRPGLRDGRDVAEPIHDRIRETIVALLPAADLREHHGRLARVLEETPGADPESVAMHLLGAGESERGGRFAQKAAERAAGALAFDQAARLFHTAIETLPTDSPKLGKLHARLGEVLGLAGRGEESGRAYIVAAEMAPAGERGGLQRAASAQLLAAGRIEEGGLMLRRVLSSAGVESPRSPLATLLSLMVYKARLQLLGLGFNPRKPNEIPAPVQARIDAIYVAALGFASINLVWSAYMQARQLVEALRAGDRARTVRAAILYCGSHLATGGGAVRRHERAVRALITRLIDMGGSAEERAFNEGTLGVGLWLRGQWREAVRTIDAGYENLTAQQASMQAQAAVFATYSYVFLGDFVELRKRVARQVADADQRGDLMTLVMMRIGLPIILKLAEDDPDGARMQIREGIAHWPRGQFLIQHSQVMRSEAEVELYAGQGAAAYERIVRDERPLKKSLLLRLQYLRALTMFIRARAAVASIEAAPERRAERLAEARKLARALRREKMMWIEPLAAMVTASVSNAEGKRTATIRALREAITAAETADMALHAAAARHQLGLLLGGKEGAELVAEAEDAMSAQDIRAPARFASMHIPGRWGAGSPK